MKNKTSSRYQLLRQITCAILIAAGYILSPILRVPGMAPVQHVINVSGAILLGPWYNLLCATCIAGLRMSTMGIPILALTGAVFGAFLSGFLYRKTGYLVAAWIGEMIGTGVIGSIVSYPAMLLLTGNQKLSWLFYTPSFIFATLLGGGLAYIVFLSLKRMGQLQKMQTALQTQPQRIWSAKQKTQVFSHPRTNN